MLLFDTSTAVEWLYGNKLLNETLNELAIPQARWYISSISTYELVWGAERKSKEHEAITRDFISKISILPVTLEISLEAAIMKSISMKKGLEFTMADVLIASTAKTENFSLLTYDKDFAKLSSMFNFGLHLLNK